mmetsp:Transcript_7304/g.22419  ORF Transcript_7304/g.22419 Transcript_7304/m.22419 type:complete len:220 (+) Transcript_7304:351-1010(+)
MAAGGGPRATAAACHRSMLCSSKCHCGARAPRRRTRVSVRIRCTLSRWLGGVLRADGLWPVEVRSGTKKSACCSSKPRPWPIALMKDSLRVQCRQNCSSLPSSSLSVLMRSHSPLVKQLCNSCSIASTGRSRPDIRRSLTSQPTSNNGSLATTTQSPWCERLKLKFGRPNSTGIVLHRKGFPSAVRASRTSACAQRSTLAQRCRSSRRPMSALLRSRSK